MWSFRSRSHARCDQCDSLSEKSHSARGRSAARLRNGPTGRQFAKFPGRVSIGALAVRLIDGGEQVKYMLLVHHDEESFRKRTEAERQHMLQESVQLAQQLHTSAQYLDAAPLHPSSETTCVRVRDGKRL